MSEIVPCAVCGVEVDIDEGNGPLCGEHQEYEWCLACEQWVDENEPECRHMIRSSCGSPLGSGSWERDEEVEAALWSVLVSIGEQWAIRLRDAMATRHYRSFFEGFLIGSSWLTFEVGGRWSDGHGFGEFRPKSAPPDPGDDPEKGVYLIHGETKVVDIGKLLTRIAEHHYDLDVEDDDWQDGVGWLASMSAEDNCRAAEALTVKVIEKWLAATTGFAVVE